jgi:hypothetical protein
MSINEKIANKFNDCVNQVKQDENKVKDILISYAKEIMSFYFTSNEISESTNTRFLGRINNEGISSIVKLNDTFHYIQNNIASNLNNTKIFQIIEKEIEINNNKIKACGEEKVNDQLTFLNTVDNKYVHLLDQLHMSTLAGELSVNSNEAEIN